MRSADPLSQDFSARRVLSLAGLVGGWDANLKSDLGCIEQVFRMPSAEILGWLSSNAVGADAHVSVDGQIWLVRERSAHWAANAGFLSDEDINAFASCAIAVLSEPDPYLPLDPLARLDAARCGARRRFSATLREGMAMTVALIGSLPSALKGCGVASRESAASRIAENLLSKDEVDGWVAASDVLPWIAEGAPEQVLASIERAIKSNSPGIVRAVGRPQASSAEGAPEWTLLRCLCWSLETLAWDERCLARATDALGALVELGVGDAAGVQAMGSLQSIYAPSMSETSASAAERIQGAHRLAHARPQVAWQLLRRVLDDEAAAPQLMRTPRIRRYAHEMSVRQNPDVQDAELREAYSLLALQLAGNDPLRVLELAPLLTDLPSGTSRQLIEALEIVEFVSASEAGLAASGQLILSWLRRLCMMNPKGSVVDDARWHLLERVAARLARQDRTVWFRLVFASDWGSALRRLPQALPVSEWLELQREQAVAERLASGELADVLRLADSVSLREAVGATLAQVRPSSSTSEVLASLFSEPSAARDEVLTGYCRACFHLGGWDWVRSIGIETMPAGNAAILLRSLPFSASTWDRVDTVLAEQRSLYWGVVTVEPFGRGADLARAASQLLLHGRPLEAIDCLGRMERDGEVVPAPVAKQALRRAAEQSFGALIWEPAAAVRVLHALQSDPHQRREDIEALEWALMPILTEQNHASPVWLERRIAADPEFVLLLVEEIHGKDGAAPVERRTCFSIDAMFGLLGRWSLVPGIRPDDSFDGEHFSRWIDSLCSAASSDFVRRKALELIGRVLRNAPADCDGLWPHRVIAEFLEREELRSMRNAWAHCLNPSRIPLVRRAQHASSALLLEHADRLAGQGFFRIAAELARLAEGYQRGEGL
jgi:hypothetical protein